jgi:hypothetical protein
MRVYNVEDESSDYRYNHLGDRVRETIVSRNAEGTILLYSIE